MTLRDLIESLHRIYLDPRVSPTTEVCVELESEIAHWYVGTGKPAETEREITCEPLSAIAIDAEGGSRRIVMSALTRSDALAR